MQIIQLAIATILLKPLELGNNRLWLLLPLCLSIAIVYKTTKVRELHNMPLAALLLFLTIVGGTIAVSAGLYVLMLIFIR